MTATYIVGNTSDVLTKLPANSVDLVMTSPPFLQLRKYVPDDNPLASMEIGREQSPADFVDVMLDIVEQCARVLAPHGSIVFELGDSSSGSGGAGGDYNKGGLREGQQRFDGSAFANRKLAKRKNYNHRRDFDVPDGTNGGCGWPQPKSLALIPEAFRIALAYGYNPLRPSRKTPPWIVRNVVTWARTNPPPGRQGDKFRRGTTDLVVATKSSTRWFDDYDVRRPAVDKRVHKEVGPRGVSAGPLDWWVIPSRTYQSPNDHAHYAAYPEELCRIPILTMCPPRVCNWCGLAPTRITEPTPDYAKLGQSMYPKNTSTTDRHLRGKTGGHSKDIVASRVHSGWLECDCFDIEDRWRPGRVLDPFAGTFTTGVVAERFGRDSIGIDFNATNVHIARERIPDLKEEHL
jgi:site-specific DNA-methyltransferase (adenine-specific)